MSNSIKAREQRCRRALDEMGYLLHKSRARHWSIDNQCGYMVVDYRINGVVAGSRYELTLEDVEDICGFGE